MDILTMLLLSLFIFGMATYNKFQDFVDQLGQGKHLFGTDVFKCMLTNEQPLVADTVKLDMVEITAENGYAAGGDDAQVTWAEAAGIATAQGTKIVWTAAGGTIGPFQFVVLYNETQTVPADPLVSWWDYGSSITLQIGETFSVKFDSSETTGDIFTLE